MEKINVSELLKDCPEGMELDCTIWNSEAKVFLKRILNDDFAYPIEVTVKYNNDEYFETFTKYGAFNDLPYCKCVIFPKGKTTWEGFIPPCKFKDGDIISDSLGTCIFKGEGVVQGTVDYYCGAHGDYFNVKQKNDGHYGDIGDYRLATEEEKLKLFDAIKANGYKWNAETKSLEKLVEPKFKVGDRIRHKTANKDDMYEISKVYDDSYGLVDFTCKLDMKYQDNYELVHNKFDISTLTPFKSKVLVRDDEGDTWYPAVWGCTGIADIDLYPYIVVGGNGFEQCIPYEGNEHLLGTTDDCEDFYKTWTES